MINHTQHPPIKGLSLCVLPVLALSCLLCLPATQARASVFLDFTTATNNFNGTSPDDNFSLSSPSFTTWTAGTGVRNSNSFNTIGLAVYNKSTADRGSTLAITESIDNLTAGMSMGLMTRLTGSTAANSSTGVMAIVGFLSGTSVQIRLFHGAQAGGGSAGTAFWNATFNLSTGGITNTTGTGGTGSTNTVSLNSPLTLSFTDDWNGTNSTFNFTLSDADGLIATSGTQVLTATAAYDNAGYTGIRFFSGNVGATAGIHTVTDYAITTVPEPEMGALGVVGLLVLARSRRHRRLAA